MSEQAYPTREWIVGCKQDAERTNKGDLGGYLYLYDVVLAMHDALDEKQAEIDRLRALLHIEADANNAARDEIDRLRAEREGQCRWAIDDSLGEHNVWVTDCGNAFVLSDGGPEANEMRFCPLCGKALVEVEVESDGEV